MLDILSARIAWRYLRAPKSHTAVSAISAVSLVGMAVATAAIVCVLSVFNGFRSLLSESLDVMTPDITISPAEGKTLDNFENILSDIKKDPGVAEAMPVVSDNALAIVDSREMPIKLLGVEPSLYSRITAADSITFSDTSFSSITPEEGIASVGTASRLGIYGAGIPMLLLAPRREGRPNLANPIESFEIDSITVSDVFQSNQMEFDENLVVCDIEMARRLFQRDGESTALYVRVKPGEDVRKTASRIEEGLNGKGVVVTDRYEAQEVSFRMVEVEKWVSFLLLIFILIIASFNIISTLCMLVVEKRGSISILTALGMSRGRIAAVFRWESIMVTLFGGLAGITLGVVLCLIQQTTGIISLGGDPENLVVKAYPVQLQVMDLLLTFVAVAAIGIVASWIAGAFAKTELKVKS